MMSSRHTLKLSMMVFLAFSALSVQPSAGQSVVGVYVVPPESASGFVDSDTKRLTDSSEDLRKQLKKDYWLRLSATPELADLSLRVTKSAIEPTGELKAETRNRPKFLGGGTRTEMTEGMAYVIRVSLEVGDYRREIVGQSSGDIPSWTAAAEDAKNQIKQWVDDNRQRLIDRRPKG